jgi:excinuclease UvrABC ATPase subunit
MLSTSLGCACIKPKVMRLIDAAVSTVDPGDTLVVVEHHPSVIASADHVVEPGHEGGDVGARLWGRCAAPDRAPQDGHGQSSLATLLRPNGR